MESPLDRNYALGEKLGIELFVKRDDLLPFPLAGNKVRKLTAELNSLAQEYDFLISNGGIASNHCRTLAIMGAQRGMKVHLVLHGDPHTAASRSALRMLLDLHADVTVTYPNAIAASVESARANAMALGHKVHIIAGGCHTPAGAASYRDASISLLSECTPDVIILASGTGATQGGIVAGVELQRPDCSVIGISVARSTERGSPAVIEAANWAGAPADTQIKFLDDYRDGGYESHNEKTNEAVRLGWAHGLPLDPTYTGKAFAALIDLVKRRSIAAGTSVVFWHTGGLANYQLAHWGPG